MRIVIFGLTVTSSWGNGHATTFRALLKALAARGHTIVFLEKDVEWYRNHRDLAQPEFCQVVLYEAWQQDAARLVEYAREADVVVIGSYFADTVPAMEALLAAGAGPVLFYDIDTPITLAGLRAEGRTEYLTTELIPQFAAYLSFSGGPSLTVLTETFHARRAIAFYCSVDAELYKPVAAEARFACDLSYLGTYAADRQAKLMELLNRPAGMLPERTFRVAGPQYPAETAWAENVQRMEHVGPADHPAFYSSSRFTLNLTRAEMVALGYSPSVRLFEAGACGAAIVSDTWVGLETFLTPGEEIVVAETAAHVAGILTGMTEEERVRLGARARERILAEHTSEARARQFEEIVGEL